MIGMGERSTPQGVETLARSLFAHGSVDRVIAVELPRERAFMHLDTAMTMIDRDAFSVYPYLPDELRSFTLDSKGAGGDFTIEENDDLFPVVADALGLDKVRVLRTPIDKMGAAARAVGRRQQLPGGRPRAWSSATSATPPPTATSPTRASRSSRSSAPSWAAAAADRAA